MKYEIDEADSTHRRGEKRIRILDRKLEGKIPLGRTRFRWKHDLKTRLKNIYVRVGQRTGTSDELLDKMGSIQSRELRDQLNDYGLVRMTPLPGFNYD
jgi:hypothetical protein